MSSELRAPFPWFGGKRRVADVVWRAFDPNIANFVEPFAGSLAVLLARPGGAGKIETVNDRDRYLANFFRAIIADPYAVAAWADGAVNEADLHARHLWLVNQVEFRERMHTDPDYCDAKIAGWWVWGLCQWIGGGWCVEPQNHKHPKLDGIGKGVHSETAHGKERNARTKTRAKMSGDSVGMGVHSQVAHPRRQMPKLSAPTVRGGSGDSGVHSPAACGQKKSGVLRGRPRPNLNSGQGIHAGHLPQKLPMLAVKADGACAGRGMQSDAAIAAYSPGRRPSMSGAGQGVHLPSLGNDRGIHGVAAIPGTFMHALAELSVPDAPPAFEWFKAIMLRMRRVRVACGDWRRVLGDSVLGKGKNVGGRRPCAVFLDPPYSHEFRDPYLYSEDDGAISALVREWALEHGDDPDLRICLAGYYEEHRKFMPANWTAHRWKGARGYAGEGNKNRDEETLFFSPHCLPIEQQRTLFGVA